MKLHKEGDRLTRSEKPGCFLCGAKPAAMHVIPIGPHSPRFLLCTPCFLLPKRERQKAIGEKFFRLQAEGGSK